MRSYLTILILIPFFGISQGPAQFKYQSVVRDAGGLIIVNSPVGVQLTIHDLSATGNVVFQEIHCFSKYTFTMNRIIQNNCVNSFRPK